MKLYQKREETIRFGVVETGYYRGRAVIRLRMDDGTVYRYGNAQLLMREWRLLSDGQEPIDIPAREDLDARIEQLYQALLCVPKGDHDRIAADFLHFPAGTECSRIQCWMAERHSDFTSFLRSDRVKNKDIENRW